MHYLSILAILRNEAMNLKVWVDHYLWQGVDHFYLIDNDSDDESNKIIKDLIAAGYPITLYELPEKCRQIEHYQYVYSKENLRENTKWLIVADLDEFFYCLDSKISIELRHYENYEHILSKWRMFGNNGLEKHPDDIRVALTKRWPNVHPNGCKYIFQPKNIDVSLVTVHHLPIEYIELSEVFRLNHYVIQSKEFFANVKMTRGAVESHHNVRDWNYFHSYDSPATYTD
jgi:hypothetical protein